MRSTTSARRARRPVPRVRTVAFGACLVTAAGLLVTISTAALGADRPRTRADRVVATTTGSVRGVIADGQRVFSGIPYAQPPVGELRWKAPRPARAWSGTRDATTPGSSCVQTAVAWRPAAASTDEDCLSVNVYTPSTLPAGKPLPVAVWFHGGGFVNGAGTDVQPAAFVRHGAVVVTVNYRLGAMGFLTLPGLDRENDSGDYGLLDQELALRWVQANAARFGGDPSKVMIAGQSAGAESVCALLSSPPAAGLFQRAVVESGLTCDLPTRAAAQTADATFATSLGCTGTDTAVVTCLRGKSPAEILDAQSTAGTWRPVVDPVVLPHSPADAFASGDFARVPVIIGGVAHETRAFVYEQNDLIKHPVTEAQYESSVRSTYGADADQVLARYPVTDYATPGAALAAVGTDSGFSCPELRNAASLSKYVPTYMYEFRDETAPLRPYELVPPSFGLGTQHTAEVPYLWGSTIMTPLTSTQRKLSDTMITYWRHFAATGAMQAQGRPDVPRFRSDDQRQVAFGTDGPVLVDDWAAAHRCGFWNRLST